MSIKSYFYQVVHCHNPERIQTLAPEWPQDSNPHASKWSQVAICLSIDVLSTTILMYKHEIFRNVNKRWGVSNGLVLSQQDLYAVAGIR